MRRLSLLLFAFVSLAGSSLVGACSDQGEGEPCSPYSDDCQSDLTCTLVSGSNNGYRCCPIPPAQPSANNICSPNNPGVNGSNPPPSEDGSALGSDAEAAEAEAGTDSASAEASVDAAVDAPDASTTGTGDAADGATE
jgi:hypothetical protein